MVCPMPSSTAKGISASRTTTPASAGCAAAVVPGRTTVPPGTTTLIIRRDSNCSNDDDDEHDDDTVFFADFMAISCFSSSHALHGWNEEQSCEIVRRSPLPRT